MSGSYDSYVVLDARANMMVECRAHYAQVRDSLESLAATVTQALSQVTGGQMATPEMTVARSDVIRALDEQRVWVETARSMLSQLVLPGDYRQTTAGQLSALQSYLVDMRGNAELAGDSMESSLSRFQVAVGADERLVAARANLMHLLLELDAASVVLREWMPDRLELLVAGLRAAQAEAARLAQQENVSAVAADSEKVAADTDALRLEVEKAVGAAGELRAQSERRDYLAQSLIRVCEDLGFQRLDVQEEMAQGEIALRFDTLDRGIVDFRISFDGRILTDSAIDPLYCAEQFDIMGEALLEEYGMTAKFTALQGDERPNERAFEAVEQPEGAGRSLPQSKDLE